LELFQRFQLVPFWFYEVRNHLDKLLNSSLLDEKAERVLERFAQILEFSDL